MPGSAINDLSSIPTGHDVQSQTVCCALKLRDVTVDVTQPVLRIGVTNSGNAQYAASGRTILSAFGRERILGPPDVP